MRPMKLGFLALLLLSSCGDGEFPANTGAAESEPEEEMLSAGAIAAGYNTGPNRINRPRKKTAETGMDPDKWFGNVERTVAKELGREPVQYVSRIRKYYVAYKRVQQLKQ